MLVAEDDQWSLAHAELEALYGSTLVGLGFLTPDLRLQRASERLAALLQSTHAELEGLQVAQRRADAEWARLADAAKQVLENDEPGLALRFRLGAAELELDLLPLRAEAPRPVGVALIAIPAQRTEAQLVAARRGPLAEVIARMTRRLLDPTPGGLFAQLERELDALAGVLRLDTALVGELDDKPGAFVRTGAVASSRARPLKETIERLSASALPWASATLRAGREVLAYQRDELPPEGVGTRLLLEELELQSLLALPLVARGKTLGVLALARQESDPADRALTFWLRLVADVMASALERDKVMAELEAARALLEGERDYLRDQLDRSPEVEVMVAQSAAMRSATELLRAVSSSDATVLLLGETGVGKELFASVIHRTSPRAKGPLVRVNCAAVPRELFEGEFFGHARGAFTGASQERKGRFELARGGTLFLDEVGEIPLDAQAKLLRVLESGVYERVGDGTPRQAEVRVVAATNVPLDRLVKTGRFRQDLFYRLAVFPITVPPLRDRREDLPALVSALLDGARRRFRKGPLDISDDAWARLKAYEWPGNVRELRNVLERAVLLSTGAELNLDGFEPGAQPAVPSSAQEEGAALETVADLRERERVAIEEALRLAGGRIAGSDGAAARMGMAPSTFRDRMKRLGIAPPR